MIPLNMNKVKSGPGRASQYIGGNTMRLRKFSLAAILGSGLLVSGTQAFARDHDDWRHDRDRRSEHRRDRDDRYRRDWDRDRHHRDRHYDRRYRDPRYYGYYSQPYSYSEPEYYAPYSP